MQVLVCDDDTAFAQKLTEQVRELLTPTLLRAHVDCVTDPTTLTNDDLEKYDLAFLDIDMGDVSGLALARRMREKRSDAILIFVTNYGEFSIEGYEVRAFRYLMKDNLAPKLEPYVKQALSVLQKVHTVVSVRYKGIDIDIPARMIVYAEAFLHRVVLHMHGFSCDTLTVYMPMDELEEKLTPTGFLRVHRAFLVNMTHIRILQSAEVSLADDTKLPISARRYKELKKVYLEWKGRGQWDFV